MTELTLVAAMDENGLLGRTGGAGTGLPWHLPDEVAHFRAYCAGKWLLLGRTTFDEMLGWLREGHAGMPLVLSGRCGWDPPMGRLVSSVPQAIAMAEAAGQKELVCVGGGQAFAAALPYANKMVLTTVHHAYAAEPGGVHFPKWEEAKWRVTRTERHARDERHAEEFTVRWMERRGGVMRDA
jgi:dihydrofolate reductase